MSATTPTPAPNVVGRVLPPELALRPCCSLRDGQIAARGRLSTRTRPAALRERARHRRVHRRADHGRRSITRHGELGLHPHPHRPTPGPPRPKPKGGVP
jgi:hypothetical protein